MGVIDWILILLIAGYACYVIFSKKKSGCCGDCSRCSNCHKNNEKTPL
jgi:hypothetical protein